MNYRLAAVAALLLAGCATAAGDRTTAAQSVTVSSARAGTVALISMTEAEGKEHGWWTVWHEQKDAERTFGLPHTFENVPPGEYVLVVFDPASETFDPNSGDPAEASDGVVIEKVTVTPTSRLEYSFQSADYKEWNCLSCPWLYVQVDGRWVKLAEVLQDVVGRAARTTTATRIPAAAAKGGRVVLRIVEEKREITSLDRVALRVGDRVILPQASPALQLADDSVIRLARGDRVELSFLLPEGADPADMELLVHGWYEPEPEFLQSVLEEYSR